MQNVAVNSQKVLKRAEKNNIFVKFWSTFLYYLFKPLTKIKNIENYKNVDTAIFVFNHNATFETLVVSSFLYKHPKIKKKVSFIIDWMFAYIPVLGKFIRANEPILVFNKKAKIKSLNKKKIPQYNVHEEAIKRLNNGESLGIYPEGTRNKDPKHLKRSRKGIGKITLQTQVAVIPIGIDFNKRLKKNKIPKFGKIILNIGKKIDFSHERKIFKKIEQEKNLNTWEKLKIIKYLEARVRYEIMLSLAKLSGKDYPFKPPVIPEIAARYFNLGVKHGKSYHKKSP